MMSTAAATPQGTRIRSVLRRLLRSPFFWGALAGVIGLPLIRPLLRHVPAPPPVIGQLPAFSLKDQQGRDFGSAQLAGQVYVASFLPAGCAAPCPEIGRAMRALQGRYDRNGDPVKLVSFTVAPARDDAAVRRLARRFGADPRRWTLVDGSPERVRDVLLEGFAAPGQQAQPGAGLAAPTAAARLALVDGQGGLRGFYRVDELGIDEIYHRSLHVLREGRR